MNVNVTVVQGQGHVNVVVFQGDFWFVSVVELQLHLSSNRRDLGVMIVWRIRMKISELLNAKTKTTKYWKVKRDTVIENYKEKIWQLT